MAKTTKKIVPLPFQRHPRECVELIVYDNDGPEGFYERVQFEHSADAIRYIMQEFGGALDNYNFKLANYWRMQ